MWASPWVNPVHPIYRDKGQFDALPGEQDEQSSNASLKK
jgi:hypothetical protein